MPGQSSLNAHLGRKMVTHLAILGPVPLVHTYLGYDPVKFGSPNSAAPDLVSGAMEHLLTYGRPRRFYARGVSKRNSSRPFADQRAGAEPRRGSSRCWKSGSTKLLETYETTAARDEAERRVEARGDAMRPPPKWTKEFARARNDENIPAAEKIWERLSKSGGESSEFAKELLRLSCKISAHGMKWNNSPHGGRSLVARR